MRLSWLVLVCLTVLAGHAQAKHVATCSCLNPITLPERDATAVPAKPAGMPASIVK